MISGGIHHQALAQKGYCESTVDEIDPTIEHIGLVKFADINNTSAESHYTDFTSISTSVVAGGTYELLIQVPYWYDDVTVAYIDWNQNLTFEETERTILTHVNDVDPECIGTVHVPVDATEGETRMRIVVAGSANPIGLDDVTGCGELEYGEVEDYTVNVDPMAVQSQFNVDKVTGEIGETFTFTQEAIGAIDSYDWNFGEGATPATATGIGPHEVTYSTTGLKDVSLTVKNADNEDNILKTELIEVHRGSASFGQPHHAYANLNYNDVTINWYAPGEEAIMEGVEDFEAGIFPPPGWDVMKSASLDEAPVLLEDQNATWKLWGEEPFLKEGKYSAMITLDKEDCNWLVSPYVNVTENQDLSFDIFFANGLDKSKFDILVLDTETDEWTNILSYDEETPTNQFKTTVKVDIAEFGGKKVRFAFIQTYTHGFNIALDNIKVINKKSNAKTEEDVVLSYNIYRDGVIIGNVDESKRNYTDHKLIPGDYTYSVSAVYDEGESFQTNQVKVTTKPVKIILKPSSNFAGINQNVKYELEIHGTAEDININFGENADPATATGEGPHNVKYAELGKKTVSIEANGVPNDVFNEIVVVRPGVAGAKLAQKVTALADFNNVNLTWRPNDVEIKLEEGFEGKDFPPLYWQQKYSGHIQGIQKPIPYGMPTWDKCDKDSFLGGGEKFIHWGEQSAAIPFDVVGCQWLITPTVEIEEGDQLRFFIRYKNGEIGNQYFHTQFHVMVKNALDWEEVFYLGAGAQPNFYENEIVVDLSDYDGEELKIAFVYEHSYGFEMAIDDVCVMNPTKPQNQVDAINIYRNDVIVTTIDDMNVTSYVDEGLETEDYKYYITAVNKNGKESFPSNEDFVRSYKIYDLPYAQNFEGSYTEVEFSDMDRPWKVGDADFFTNDTYHFPDNDGTFAGINCAEDGNKIVSDYMILSPMNLDTYWNQYIEFDYVNEIHEFTLVGRQGIEGDWINIEQIAPSTSWKHHRIEIPKEMRKNGYQFAFFASNASFEQNGVAVDNIQIGYDAGSTIRLVYQDEFVNPGEGTLLGSCNLDETKTFPMTIKNVDANPVTINSISLSNAEFSIVDAPTAVTINTGETYEFKVQLTGTVEKEYDVDLTINNDSDEPAYNVNLKVICGKSNWTYMVYLYEDHTGLDGATDINELEVNGSLPGRVNYVVLYDADDDSKDGIYYIQKDKEGMNYQIKSPIINTDLNEDLDMNDPATLTAFTTWVKANFPAEHYGLNVWDHGSGIFKKRKQATWKNAIGEMEMWELASSLQEFKDIDGKGLDILGFDVCLAGQVETVYEFKDLADVVVFSEKTEPGTGWEYTTQYAPLNANPNINSYSLANHFVNAYADSYRPGGSQSTGEEGDAVTLSAVRTDRFKEDFLPQLEVLSAELVKVLPEHKTLLVNAINNSWSTDGTTYAEHKDLGSFLVQFASCGLPEELRDAANALNDKYDYCIINSQQNLCPQATGMKIWMPLNIAESDKHPFYLMPHHYLKFGETSWDEFLKALTQDVSPGGYAIQFKQYSPSEILLNDSVQFCDMSIANPMITKRTWTITPNTYEFVDNTNKHSAAPCIKFTGNGNYDITLTIKNAEGDHSETFENQIIVRDGNYHAPANLYYNYNVDTKEVLLVWTQPEEGYDGTLKGYRVYRDDVAIATIDSPNGLTHTDVNEEGVNRTYHVTALYLDPEGESGPSNVINLVIPGNEVFNTPRDLTAEYNPIRGEVTLQWKRPEEGYDGTLSGYKVYRNGEAVGSVDSPNALTFTEDAMVQDNLSYYVTALYVDPEGESDKSNEVIVDFVGTEEFANSPIKVYPNPSMGVINIFTPSTDNATYQLSDMNGNMIKHGELSNTRTALKIEHAGVYFLKVLNNNKVSVEKIIIR